MTRTIVAAAIALMAGTVWSASHAAASSCPRHQVDGVSASACQIGDDIQVVGHNYNNYSVTFTVKVTYRLKHEGERTRWVEGRFAADGGGQLADWRNPDASLQDVTDVEVRNVVQR